MAGYGGSAGPGAMGAGNQGDAASSQGGHGGTSGGSHNGGSGGPHGGHTGNFGDSGESDSGTPGTGLGSGHGDMVSGPGGYDSGWGGLSDEGGVSQVGGVVGPNFMSHMTPDNWGTIVGGTFHGMDYGGVTDSLSKAHESFSLEDIFEGLEDGLSLGEIEDLATVTIRDYINTALAWLGVIVSPLSMIPAAIQTYSLYARQRDLEAARAFSMISKSVTWGGRFGSVLGQSMLGQSIGLGFGLGFAANEYGIPVGDDRTSFGWDGIGSGHGDGSTAKLHGFGSGNKPMDQRHTPGISTPMAIRERPSKEMSGTESLLQFFSAYSLFNSKDKMSATNMLGDLIYISSFMREAETHAGIEDDSFLINAVGFSGMIFLFEQSLDNERGKLLF